MEKITLYTCGYGFLLFEEGEAFYASDVKSSDSDLEFTVNKEDVVFLEKDGNENLYEVINLDSVEWVKGKNEKGKFKEEVNARYSPEQVYGTKGLL